MYILEGLRYFYLKLKMQSDKYNLARKIFLLSTPFHAYQ